MKNIEQIFERFQMDPTLLYDAIVQSTDDYIYIIDMRNHEALVSDNMNRDFKLPGTVFHGLISIWGDLVHAKDRDRFFNSINAMVEGKTDGHNLEYQVQNHTGEYIWVVCRGLLKRDRDGAPTLFIGVVTNLAKKGRVDPTTGLFTHSNCVKLLQKLYARQDDAVSSGILLLGLDNFSTINNLNNHSFGDMVLRYFAQVVQSYLPSNATIYRFDGDQFAIVYIGATKATLVELYGKIHIYFSQRHNIDGTSYFCTVSGGIAMLQEDANNYLDLIKYASSALAASKKSGKNTYTLFSPELISSSLHTQEIEKQLQISISEEMSGFQLVYQPIVNTNTSTIRGAEALLRWSHKSLGNISPVEFIPILESNGLIIPVGKWILEQAISTCKEWVKKNDNFVVNINISYLQLLESGFVSFLKNLLTHYELDARHILLELTESYFVTDMAILAETFHALRAMGARIAMDDFGTGYSSLGMLAKLPADVVKIDREFITMIDKNHFNQTFIAAVIALCHNVGMTVCVEGVEREEELHIVQSLSADYIQGFYFSKPISKSSFSNSL